MLKHFSSDIYMSTDRSLSQTPTRNPDRSVSDVLTPIDAHLPRGDYGYVMLETVDFCLRNAISFVEHLLIRAEWRHQSSILYIDMGFCISFCFVGNHGSCSTFSKRN